MKKLYKTNVFVSKNVFFVPRSLIEIVTSPVKVVGISIKTCFMEHFAYQTRKTPLKIPKPRHQIKSK